MSDTDMNSDSPQTWVETWPQTRAIRTRAIRTRAILMLKKLFLGLLSHVKEEVLLKVALEILWKNLFSMENSILDEMNCTETYEKAFNHQ